MKNIYLFLCLLCFAGCARPVEKELIPTGGSKADGIVELSFEYDGIYEEPIIDDNVSNRNAAKRCESWGYKGAEAFGGSLRECTMPDGSYCRAWIVTKKYQCTE